MHFLNGPSWRRLSIGWIGWRTVLLALACRAVAAAPLVAFDFTRPEVAAQWRSERHITLLTNTPAGLAATLAGEDPYFSGPARDYPADTPLWVELRIKSEIGGGAQLFFYRDHPTEEKSVRFHVLAGGWRTARVKLPPLGAGYRFRMDPPGNRGNFVLASLSVTAAIPLRAPAWAKPATPLLGPDALAIRSGALEMLHATSGLNRLAVRVNDLLMAIGHDRPQIGYLHENQLHWLTADAAHGRGFAVRRKGASLMAGGNFQDTHGGQWHFAYRYTPSATADAIDVEIAVQVSADRSVVHLPLLTLLPGVGAFGTNKHQALFAGLEYLANEPSSSEADLRGPAANRLVPDTLKITFPLMVIQEDDRYVGMSWEMQPNVCALFDSPDRVFQSGGHAMGLLFPGANGSNREDGHLLPHDGVRLAANQPLVVRATLLGGAGQSVVPAVRKFVELRGLPPLPQTMGLAEYARLAAAGWLDSQAREGNRYRHAVWPGFGAQPAADVACYLDWLVPRVSDQRLAGRLTEAAAGALGEVRPEVYYSSAVSHVRYPVVPLVYGHVLENVRHAAQVARNLLARFEPDGRVRYRPLPGKPDYGSTHFAPDANGLTAQVVMSLLDAAVFSGDASLMAAALQRLRALDRFRNTVPRGAQTWECPLHTPDILASAHLVRAYTQGYELTGELAWLEEARYWAWTGVPFIYLRHPPDQPMGPYLTPPVYGATSWVAPVWMGLPVQWCGLVYADALYRLVRHDPNGPWQQLADGITLGGVQITWPLTDQERQGLLPDVFHLRDQHRDGPAINPGTVQACAVRWFAKNPLYDFQAVRELGWTLHAPGGITAVRAGNGAVQFTANVWPPRPAYVLINGLKGPPKVRLNGRETTLDRPHQFVEGHLVLQVQGRTEVAVEAK